MIDLNLKHEEKEEPLGLVILGTLPFVIVFWALIEVML